MTLDELHAELELKNKNTDMLRDIIFDFIRNNYQGRTVSIHEWAALVKAVVKYTT